LNAIRYDISEEIPEVSMFFMISHRVHLESLVLLIIALFLTSCSVAHVQKSGEIPTPALQTTPHPVDIHTIKSFCVSVTGNNTEGVDQALAELLKAMNYEVAADNETCDATVHFLLDGQPLSPSYQVNNKYVYSECFTGAKFTGEIKVTADNAIPLIVPVYEILIPQNSNVDVCPDANSAPYRDVWTNVLINGMHKLLGDKVYLASLQIQNLRGQIDWLGKGPYSEELVSGLINLLNDEDPQTRWYTALTISNMNPIPAEIIPILIKRIKVETSNELDVVGQLWSAVQNAGEVAASTLPDIENLLTTSPDLHMRWEAAKTIGDIGTPSPDAVLALINALHDSAPQVRMWAARSLGAINAAPKDSVQELIYLLSDPVTEVKMAAYQALSLITHHPEIDPKNIEAWQNWWSTPRTPTPLNTLTP
jgi:hypothetical protein